ncbi:hypothetical protein [Luteimonas panaciterrae]|uniref:hypothetical protein n=1 Tax=Luteimonas panaciterrae TaxID=363885 RepID=UPI001CFB9085|nr:hypothetical protein [Luteimonas panaciterrae]
MSTYNNTAPSPFDQLHWTAQELAEAVPRRLHELVRFDAQTHEAANSAAKAVRRLDWQRRGYAPNGELPAFIRVC